MAFVDHPAAWRQRAAMLRLVAEHLSEPGDKTHQMKLAALYDRFANYADERLRHARASSPSPVDSTNAVPSSAAPDHDAASDLLRRCGLLPTPKPPWTAPRT
jgi:hypothetical protein